MTTARTIFSILLLALAAYVVVMNWFCLILNTRNRRRGIDQHSSMLPLISIIATVAAYHIFPHPNAEWMFLIPLLDLSIWLLFLLPIFLLWDAIRKSHSHKIKR